VWLSQTAVILLGFSTFFVGCSRQSEGERCDKEAAGDTDCNTGLYCIRCDQLQRGGVDRCCPLDPNAHTDSDCDRADTPRLMGECQGTATGGSGGIGGRSGAGAGGSAAASGAGGSDAMSGAGGSGATSGSSGEAGAGEPAGAGGQEQ
jgi:hypothetical protein